MGIALLTGNLQLSEAEESLFPNITLPLNANPSLLLFKSPPPRFSPELGYPLPSSIEGLHSGHLPARRAIPEIPLLCLAV